MIKQKKQKTFCYLTREYLMMSESLLNNVSMLSSRILSNMGFLVHWETESVTAEIIQLLCNKISRKKQLFMFSCYKDTKKQLLLLVPICKKYTQSKISVGIGTMVEYRRFMLYN